MSNRVSELLIADQSRLEPALRGFHRKNMTGRERHHQSTCDEEQADNQYLREDLVMEVVEDECWGMVGKKC
jgi:hypothetical protein